MNGSKMLSLLLPGRVRPNYVAMDYRMKRKKVKSLSGEASFLRKNLK